MQIPGVFGGGKTPLEKCKPGENRGDFRGFSGGPAKSAGGEIWRILSNLADFWPIFGRISSFFILRKHGRTASGTPPKSPGFPEVHPPGPPGDPPGRKNGPFSGGKTSESTVEGPKFRGVFSGGHPGAPGGEFREISGNSGKFRPNCPQNQPHLPPFFPILNLRKHGRTAEMSGAISGGFRGVQLVPILGRCYPGKTPCFPGENPPKYRTKT